MEKVNIIEKLGMFADYWNPRIIGELNIVPRTIEHKPVADEEVHLLLFEPSTTMNTGNVENEKTRKNPERI